MHLSENKYLKRIRESLLMMSSLADRNVGLAIRALLERNDELADTVEIEDDEIDRLEKFIDDEVNTYMALRTPVATDCRFMIVALKIAINLERVGDEAVSIARRARRLCKETELTHAREYSRMSEIVVEMLRDSIESFIQEKPDLAESLRERDKAVDIMDKSNSAALGDLMEGESDKVRPAMELVLVSRSLERIADHAKNIGEEAYFLYRAKGIR